MGIEQWQCALGNGNVHWAMAMCIGQWQLAIGNEGLV
jgi:hypothetical protein